MADEQPPDERPEPTEAARKDVKRRSSEAARSDDPSPESTGGGPRSATGLGGFDDALRGERSERSERHDRTEDAPRPGRLYRLGRRLLNSGDDVRELASAVLDSSDRAKTEMVRMVAREVRNYLDELKIKEDVKDLVTKHSLEMHVSFSLKPLAGKPDGDKKPDGNG